jgi:hypothetical protein
MMTGVGSGADEIIVGVGSVVTAASKKAGEINSAIGIANRIVASTKITPVYIRTLFFTFRL